MSHIFEFPWGGRVWIFRDGEWSEDFMRNDAWYNEKREELYSQYSGEVMMLMKKLPKSGSVLAIGVAVEGESVSSKLGVNQALADTIDELLLNSG